MIHFVEQGIEVAILGIPLVNYSLKMQGLDSVDQEALSRSKAQTDASRQKGNKSTYL